MLTAQQPEPAPREQARTGSVELQWRGKGTPGRITPLAPRDKEQPARTERATGPALRPQTRDPAVDRVISREQADALRASPTDDADEFEETLEVVPQHETLNPVDRLPTKKRSSAAQRSPLSDAHDRMARGRQPAIDPEPWSVHPQAQSPGPTEDPDSWEEWDPANDRPAPLDELWGLPRVFQPRAYSRFTGRGEPLLAGSWLNRPYYFGGFIGGITGDTLIPGEVNQNGGFIGGFRLGWDYDHYWGLETRLAFTRQGLDFIQSPLTDNVGNDLLLWDASLIYYPWGDARWRPYFGVGLGLVDYDYSDTNGLRRTEAVFGTPLSVGVKYRANQAWTWRVDVTDNLIWGGEAGFETQNQFSFTAGLEYRFGGKRRSYWPWNPSSGWR